MKLRWFIWWPQDQQCVLDCWSGPCVISMVPSPNRRRQTVEVRVRETWRWCSVGSGGSNQKPRKTDSGKEAGVPVFSLLALWCNPGDPRGFPTSRCVKWHICVMWSVCSVVTHYSNNRKPLHFQGLGFLMCGSRFSDLTVYGCKSSWTRKELFKPKDCGFKPRPLLKNLTCCSELAVMQLNTAKETQIKQRWQHIKRAADPVSFKRDTYIHTDIDNYLL